MAIGYNDQTKRVARFLDIINVSDYPFHSIDLMRMLLGTKIGDGMFRAVFECDLIPNTVIKVSNCETPANTIEFSVWQSVKSTPHAKWFAPCLHLSPEGNFLIQRKCRPLTDKDKLPKNIPGFFTDIKRENWGFIGKQLVCHDYQFLDRAIDIAMDTRREFVK